jgi:hypothetical protein
MPADRDFHLTIDRAAGLTLDATCACRAAAQRPLPAPHRRLLNSAIRSLERAQLDLVKARNDPWHPPQQPKPKQLSLHV